MMHSLFRQLLPIDAFQHILLPCPVIADSYEEASHSVACDGAAEDDGGDGERSDFVVPAPGNGAEGDLEQRVAI